MPQTAVFRFDLQVEMKQVRLISARADTLIRSSFIYFIYMGGTGRCDSCKIILEFHDDQMCPRNLGSQINISMRPTRIDKTNIPSMRRV